MGEGGGVGGRGGEGGGGWGREGVGEATFRILEAMYDYGGES